MFQKLVWLMITVLVVLLVIISECTSDAGWLIPDPDSPDGYMEIQKAKRIHRMPGGPKKGQKFKRPWFANEGKLEQYGIKRRVHEYCKTGYNSVPPISKRWEGNVEFWSYSCERKWSVAELGKIKLRENQWNAKIFLDDETFIGFKIATSEAAEGSMKESLFKPKAVICYEAIFDRFKSNKQAIQALISGAIDYEGLLNFDTSYDPCSGSLADAGCSNYARPGICQ